MSDRQYVHFGHRRSWHVVRTPTRMFNTYITLCGRTVVSLDLMAELPAAKSCESCLRIAKRQDEQPIDDDGSTWPDSVP